MKKSIGIECEMPQGAKLLTIVTKIIIMVMVWTILLALISHEVEEEEARRKWVEKIQQEDRDMLTTKETLRLIEIKRERVEAERAFLAEKKLRNTG